MGAARHTVVMQSDSLVERKLKPVEGHAIELPRGANDPGVIQWLALALIALALAASVVSAADGNLTKWDSSTIQASGLTIAVSLLAILLVRTNNAVAAGHLLVAAVFAIVWFFTFLALDQPRNQDVLLGLVYAPMAAAILLKPVWAAVYSAGNLLGLGMLLMVPNGAGLVTLDVVIFGVGFGTLTTVAAYLRQASVESALKHQRSATRREREMQAMLDGSQDAQVFADDTGRIAHANRRFVDLFGIQAQVNGQLMSHLLPPEINDLIQKSKEKAIRQPVIWEFSIEGDNPKQQTHVEAILVGVDHGESDPFTLLSLRDITDRKRSIEERERAVHEARTSLLNLISHHLRTPLTPIRMDLYTLRHAATGALGERQATALDRMEREFKRLSKTLDLLVDASLLARTGLAGTQSCDLAQALTEALGDHEQRVEIHNDLAGPKKVLADPRSVRVVIRLLVDWLGPHSPWHIYSDDAASVRIHFVAGTPGPDAVELDINHSLSDIRDETVFANHMALFVVGNAVRAQGGSLEAYASPEGRKVSLSLPSSIASKPQHADGPTNDPQPPAPRRRGRPGRRGPSGHQDEDDRKASVRLPHKGPAP